MLLTTLGTQSSSAGAGEHPNVAWCGQRCETVEGFKDGRQQSKQEEVGRRRRRGECQSKCDGDWISAVAREKPRDSEWNRITCCDGCVRFASCVELQVLLDLSARKVNGKLRDVLFWCVKPGMAETCKVTMAVSETNEMSHDAFFPCCDVGAEVCMYHEGWRSKLELDPNGLFELPVEIVSHDARTTGGKGKSGLVSSL